MPHDTNTTPIRHGSQTVQRVTRALAPTVITLALFTVAASPSLITGPM